MDSISFQSRIRPVGINDFLIKAREIGEKGNACAPWTVIDSAINPDVFTRGIIDCTACGITDGKNAFLTHICPTVRENRDFTKIENFIRTMLKPMKQEYLQAILVGSQGKEPRESRVLFNKFVDLMERLNIPASIFRAADNDVDIAYIEKSDEWIIATKDVPALLKDRSPEEAIREIFEEVKLSEKDEFVQG